MHVGLGATLLRLGEVDSAYAEFRAALAIDAHDIDAARYLICALDLLCDAGEAVGAWCALAAAYANSGSVSGPVAACRQAVSRKPDCLKALVKVGQAHLELGDPKEALRWYQAASAIEPEQGWAYNGAG